MYTRLYVYMKTFPEHLRYLRKQAALTDRELAALADVPRSFVTSVQNGNRVIGELQARKIGEALKLTGHELDCFVLLAIDSCQHKVLTKYNTYPSEVLNHLARQLNGAGITPEQITACQQEANAVALMLKDGRKAVMQAQLMCA